MNTKTKDDGSRDCIKEVAGSDAMGDLISFQDDEGGMDSVPQQECKNKDFDLSSDAAFVKGGMQDACVDSCSICLEPFCDSDPATVTSCKHGYHLQCILEWAQRSKECPICWRTLSFEDPNSQELFEAVEQERASMQALDDIQFRHVPAYVNYAHFEERLMQHLARQLARRAALQRRTASMHDEGFMHPSSQAPRQSLSPGSVEGRPRTGISDIFTSSESLKSRFLAASSKWKETVTRTTHVFKERWRTRSNSPADFRAGVQEVNADVVRQAIKNIAPDSVEKDTHGAASSSSLSPIGARDGESLIN